MTTPGAKTWTKADAVEAVRSGYDKFPCLRCGEVDHSLIQCRNKPKKDGALWRALGIKQLLGLAALNDLRSERLNPGANDAAQQSAAAPLATLTDDEKRNNALKDTESRKKMKQQTETALAKFPHRKEEFRDPDRNVAAKLFRHFD